MPPVAAAVAAYLAISTAMAYVVIAMAVITLASLAYSAYMIATMETATTSDAVKRLQTVRSAIQPHRVIYGECMTGGVLVYAQSFGWKNSMIALVVAFTGHEVEEIKEVWLNDKLHDDNSFWRWEEATPAGGYWGQSGEWEETTPARPAQWVSYVQVWKYRGTPDQEADPFLTTIPPNPTTVITESPSTGLDDLVVYNPHTYRYFGQYTGQGMCVFTITIDTIGTTDENGTVLTPDTFTWSQDVYPGDGTSELAKATGSASMVEGVIYLTDGVSIAFGEFSDQGNFTFATIGHSVGQTWEVRAFDGAPWTSDCRLRGRSYVVVVMENSDTVFPTGLPNVKALIKGNNQIYDPRTGTTGYSDNWALCVRDYLTKPYGLNCPASDINEDAAIAAANICDELVPLANGNTQKRYPINGSFTVDKKPTAIMNEILAAAYGAITWCQGQYRIFPAAYYEPDLTFHGMNPDVPGLTESDLRGQIKVRPRVSMKDRFNTVKGTYISPTTWQAQDFAKVTNAMYVEQDGGEEIAKDIQLAYVTDSRMAQRIAKIVLEKGRQGMVVDFPAKWSAFPLSVGDNVPVTIALLGWDQKIFKVTDWKMSPDGGVDLSLEEDAAGCYEWNFGEETTVDLAPNTLLPDPRFVEPVTGLTVGEELYRIGAIVKSRAILTWTDTRVAQYEVAYTGPGNSIWAPLSITANTTATLDDTMPGSYTFRVRGMNHLGVWGEWTVTNYQMLGKSAPPPPVDSFLVAAQPDGTREFTWSMANPPLDLAGYRLRYLAGTSGEWANMADLQTGLVLASPFETNQLPAGDYVFAIVSEDTTGNQSAPKYSTVNLADPRMAGVVLSVSCGSLGWPGTKSNCAVDENGALVAIGTDDWASFSASSWAAWTSWNQNPASPIQYDHPTIDLGAVTLFTPIVNFAGNGTATVTVSTSSDNSTWSSYAAATSVTARYIKVRVSLAGAYPIFRSLIIHISAQSLTEDINDLDTSTLTGNYRIGTGDIRLPRAKSYSAITSVQIALQGTGAGWSWKVIDKASTYGPRVQIYNGSGVLADAVIDATIKGV